MDLKRLNSQSIRIQPHFNAVVIFNHLIILQNISLPSLYSIFNIIYHNFKVIRVSLSPHDEVALADYLLILLRRAEVHQSRRLFLDPFCQRQETDGRKWGLEERNHWVLFHTEPFKTLETLECLRMPLTRVFNGDLLAVMWQEFT